MAAPVRLIVLNYNGGAFVLDCVAALHRLDWPADALEIVVIDNASVDGSADAIAVRLKEAVRDHYMQVVGPKHFGRKLTAIFIASAIFFFAIATGRYDVNANATLEGAIRRVVVRTAANRLAI